MTIDKEKIIDEVYKKGNLIPDDILREAIALTEKAMKKEFAEWLETLNLMDKTTFILQVSNKKRELQEVSK